MNFGTNNVPTETTETSYVEFATINRKMADAKLVIGRQTCFK
jgi:hypothetical protein